MKKHIIKLCIILVTLIAVNGCQKEYPLKFDSGTSVIGFNKSALTITEDGTAGSVNLYLGAATGANTTDVTLQVSVEGIANPAIEGTDFTLSSKNVSVGVGETAVTITPIDNGVFQGDKQFILLISSNSNNYSISAQKSVTVSISDDEHPLKAWLGTFTVEAVSYGDDFYGEAPGSWDEEWTVVVTPVEGKLDQVSMLGIAGSTIPILATIDKDAMTITIAGAQVLSDTYGNGAVTVYNGYDDMTYSETDPLTGTVKPDGTILVDGWCHFNDGWVWDVFNTTWTKQ